MAPSIREFDTNRVLEVPRMSRVPRVLPGMRVPQVPRVSGTAATPATQGSLSIRGTRRSRATCPS